MPSYFIESHMVHADRVEITGPLARHLGGSLRLRAGERLVLVNGRDRLDTVVEEAARDRVGARITEIRTVPEDPVRVTLAMGLPKGKKLEEVVRRAVELGVHRVVPVVTGRSVPRPGEKEGRGERLAAIALEAAQQSGRMEIPAVSAPIDLDAFLAEPAPDLGLVLWERETTRPMLDLLEARGGGLAAGNLTLFVGPEGGLSEKEVARLVARGYHCAHMGPYILRTETAAIACLAVAAATLWRGARP